MKPAALLATGGVFLLFVGYALGRYVAPARVEERERVVTKVVEVQSKTKETSSEQNQSSSERIVYKTRFVQKPDGTVVKTTEAASAKERESRAETKQRETEVRYVDRIQEVEKTKIVERSSPAWGVAVGAGLSSGLNPVYRGELSRSIIGPLEAGIYASTAREMGVVARVRF